MGISTILKLYLANAVINNYDEGKTFVILTPKLSSTYEFLEEVKRLIKQHYDSNKIIVDNKQKLELINGNRIMVCSNSINLFRGYRIDEIIIDGGNYIDNLENIIACVTSGLQMGGKIILASSNSKNNTFFKRIFNDESNKFVKKRITWDLHPNRGKEWYDDMSKHITKEDLEIELDIIDYVEVVEPIKKTISLRIDSSLIDKVSLKLVDMDINLSEYIRRLIEKDLV
jgi:predicted DNA binding CopG/RHH family protein